MGLVSSASLLWLCCVAPSLCPRAGDAEGGTFVPAEHPLPLCPAPRGGLWKGQTSILPPTPGPTPIAECVCSCTEELPLLSFVPVFCRAPVPHSLHRFQEKLKKPGDTGVCFCVCCDMGGLFISENCSCVQSVVKNQTEHFVPHYYLNALYHSLLLFLDGFLFFLSDLASFFWYTELTPRLRPGSRRT